MRQSLDITFHLFKNFSESTDVMNVLLTVFFTSKILIRIKFLTGSFCYLQMSSNF